MGTGKFVTVYPGVWTEREKPYAEEYFAKIKELEDRGPIDVQALISGKIRKGHPGLLQCTGSQRRYDGLQRKEV